jgi:hypothetical protein
MNKRSANQQGLVFTGNFSWDKEEIKNKANEIRKAGYRAVVVSEPPNPLSRGHHGTGYSVFVEPKYVNDGIARDCRSRVSRHDDRLASIRAAFEAKLAEEINAENQRNARDVEWLDANGYGSIGGAQ